jgi:dienelactone hydrolase
MGNWRGMHRYRGVLVAALFLVVIGLAVALWPSPSPTGRSGGAHGLSDPAPGSGRPTSTTTTATHPAPQPPFAVEPETETFTDPSRPTPDRGDVAGHPGRTLVTVIRRPMGLPGPLPLIVFAHGWDSNPGVYETLLDTWAAAGYLVAAPTFPDSASTLPGEPISDYPQQSLDLSFVITQLLGGVAGPVNPAKIAVAGHSDGGTDIALLALNPVYADHRIRAYISLSGEIPAGVPGTWSAATPGALFVAVGTDDEYGLYPQAQQVFASADMPKAFVTLDGGDHLQTFIGDTPGAAAMRAQTVTFLNTVFATKSVTSTQIASALEPPAGTGTGISTGLTVTVEPATGAAPAG